MKSNKICDSFPWKKTTHKGRNSNSRLYWDSSHDNKLKCRAAFSPKSGLSGTLVDIKMGSMILRKHPPRGSLSGITRIAEWCQTVTRGTDFSIYPSDPWQVLFLTHLSFLTVDFYTSPHNNGGVLWFYVGRPWVRPLVRPSVRRTSVRLCSVSGW